MERLVLSHIVDLDRIVRYVNVTPKLFNDTNELNEIKMKIIAKEQKSFENVWTYVKCEKNEWIEIRKFGKS